MHSPDKLWVSLFKDKYLHNGSIFPLKSINGSVVWNSIQKAMNVLMDGFQFKVGNGLTRFWYDCWLFKEPLCIHVPFVFIHDRDVTIRDVSIDGNWNLGSLYTQLPDAIKQRVTCLSPNLVETLDDVWVWSHSIDGIYSTRSAYQMLNESNNIALQDRNWSWIWKACVPANIQFFIWQLCHNSLPIRQVLNHRNVTNTSICPSCNTQEESLHHCFFECNLAIEVWNACNISIDLLPQHGDDVFDWLYQTTQSLGVLILILLWKYWNVRNKWVFEGVRIPVNVVVSQIWGLYWDTVNAFGVGNETNQLTKSPREVKWQKPPVDWVTLNVDGSAMTNPGMAGFGGIIRDNEGRFLKGFYGSIGVSNILHAELMGLYHGIQMCWEVGYKRVMCYTDSLHTIHLLSKPKLVYHKYANEVLLLKKMLERHWEVHIEHVFREANACADYLAKMGARSDSGFETVEDPPIEMQHLLLADALGVVFWRF